MRIVVQRTGLSPDVLRVWEKRHGAVTPVRSAGGQRYYTDADVHHLGLLVRAIAGGRSIGQVAQLPPGALVELVDRDADAAQSTLSREVALSVDANGAVLAAALSAIDRFDATGLERLLRAAALRLGADEMLGAVASPLVATIGERSHAGLMRPAKERVATSAIGRTLAWMTENALANTAARRLVVAAPSGQNHELGATLVAAVAASNGWQAVCLGANMPAGEIADAADAIRAPGVALSITSPQDDPNLAGELRLLRQALPPDVQIVASGAAAPAHAAVLREVRAIILPDFAALRSWLRKRAADR